MQRKIAMFGGSFNPVHNAHTEFARQVINSAELDLLYVVPTYSPPHKTDINLAAPEHRLNMCRLAFENIEKARVSDIEIRRGGKSYTCDTLKELKKLYPNDSLFLVMGADMFMTLQDWKNPREIFSLAQIITFPRNGDSCDTLLKQAEKLKPLGAKAVVLCKPVLILSSTDIRNRIHNPQFVREHLDSNVYKYIEDNKLYGM